MHFASCFVSLTQNDFIYMDNISRSKQDFSFDSEIAASMEKVFKMLTEKDELQRWWENPVEELENGRVLRFGFEESDEHSIMNIDIMEFPSKVQWTVIQDTGFEGEWIGTKILFQLKPLGRNKCVLHFLHIGLTPNLLSYEPCKSGWMYYISNIKKICESP